MNLNKRTISIVIITILLGVFVSGSSLVTSIVLNKKTAIGVVVLGALGYYLLWVPYRQESSPPNPNLSTTLKNLYSNPTIRAKKYNEVPIIASHNSFTYPHSGAGWTLQTVFLQNQILDVKKQLEFGVRGFLIDIYTDTTNLNAPIYLSHGKHKADCSDASTIGYTRNWLGFLGEIEQYLSANRDEIITLYLESCVHNYVKIMRDMRQTKLDRYLYVIAHNSVDWDTRDQMIKTGKRLVIFSDASGDIGNGIMDTRDYILENHYEKDICEHRPFQRLKLPPICVTQNNMNLYQCIRQNMAISPVGQNQNKGAIVFLMNHFQGESTLGYIKRAFPGISIFGYEAFHEIRDYFSFLNSYKTIRSKIRECYCQFQTDTTPPVIMKLNTYPNVIALDFIGEVENDSGVRGVIIDMLSGNFTISAC